MAGFLTLHQGRVEGAIELVLRALARDPLNASIYNSLGFALFRQDRFTESEAALRKALELSPERAATHASLSRTLLAMGGGEEALAEASRESAGLYRITDLAIIHHALGRGAESEGLLQELIVAYSDRWRVSDRRGIRGTRRSGTGTQWLERAAAQADPGLAEVKVNPYFRPLHRETRWAALLKKLGLED